MVGWSKIEELVNCSTHRNLPALRITHLCGSHEQEVDTIAAVGRVVDVVSREGEEGRHLPQDIGRMVHVHVLEDADLADDILPHRNRHRPSNEVVTK